MELRENGTGKLYGLGVGPGDPELLTLKAARLIRDCQVIAIPTSGNEINVAYEIAKGAVPEIIDKEIVEVSMPMIRDVLKLQENHDIAAEKVITELEKGKNVAFLTLGDPTIYSSYIYIHERIVARGYETEIVPGIPSFCAAAARLNQSLTESGEALHIIPASYDGIEEALLLNGTRVLMKSGKSIGKIKSLICEMENPPSVKMVERCGMEGERVFTSVEDIDKEASYFSLLIVKDKK